MHYAAGAVTGDQFEGPWVFGTANDVHFPLLVDTACKINLLSSDVASALGLEVKAESTTVGGVGEGSVDVIGTTTMDLKMGDYNCRSRVRFLVTNGFCGLVFLVF